VTESADIPVAELAARLDRISDLMALTLVRRMEESEQIRVLAAVGYSPAEIGALLGKRPNTVSVTLSRQRKKPAGAKSTTRKRSTRKKPAGKKTAARRRRR
jgi:DNA-directed RNA polymerase specialized sigma24 family protein